MNKNSLSFCQSLTLSACLFGGMIGMAAFSVAPSSANAADQPIPKFLLIQLTRDQAGAMCSSSVFTECMEFDAKKCNALSEEAIELCLGPLPDEIDPQTLQNSTLEQCPQQVYKKEGLSEEKAKMCFQKAMEAASEDKSE